MLTKIIRLLGIRRSRRRSSTKLTANYTKRETAHLRKCRAQFESGTVGKYHPDAPKAQAMFSGEMG